MSVVRWKKGAPCPICGGWEGQDRGKGTRCYGYLSTDQKYAHCTREEFAEGLEKEAGDTYAHRLEGRCKCGTTHGAARESTREKRGQTPPDLIHPYESEERSLLFQVLRWGSGKDKKILQRRPDGAGGWIWHLTARCDKERCTCAMAPAEARRVLYRLPELLAADPAAIVLIVEGERDCDDLRRLGLVATTNPGGAGKWSLVAAHAQDVLKDRKCVVIADDDKPGQTHAKQVAKTLRCPILTLPDAHDAGDWIAKGGKREALEALIADAQAKHQAKRDAPSPTGQALQAIHGDWTRRLLRNKREDGSETSTLRKIAANGTTILRHDKRWEGVVAFNKLAESVVTLKLPPWGDDYMPKGAKPGEWTDGDTIRLRHWLSAEYGLDLGKAEADQVVSEVADCSTFDPLCDWLDSLKWDGTNRADTWLQTIFGVEDTKYTRAVGRMYLISAVARAFDPGSKVDTILALLGKPGLRKSFVLRELAGDEWFIEIVPSDLASKDKDSKQNLRGKWICEVAEGDALSRSDQAHVKADITKRVDTFRESYGRRSRDHVRRIVFALTTNKDSWIVDESGGMERRILPVKCITGDETSVAKMKEMRSQLWAEAVHRYRNDERWWITDPELEEAARQEQEALYLEDEWTPLVFEWLRDPRHRRLGDMTRATGEPLVLPKDRSVCIPDVLAHALGVAVDKQTRDVQMRVGKIMHRLRYTRVRRAIDGQRIYLYVPHGPSAAPGASHDAHANGALDAPVGDVGGDDIEREAIQAEANGRAAPPVAPPAPPPEAVGQRGRAEVTH